MFESIYQTQLNGWKKISVQIVQWRNLWSVVCLARRRHFLVPWFKISTLQSSFVIREALESPASSSKKIESVLKRLRSEGSTDERSHKLYDQVFSEITSPSLKRVNNATRPVLMLIVACWYDAVKNKFEKEVFQKQSTEAIFSCWLALFWLLSVFSNTHSLQKLYL